MERLGAEAAGERRIDREARVGIENFVAGFDERHHRERERHLAAGRDQDLFDGAIDAASALQIGGDRFAQGGNAARGNVAVAAFDDGGAQGIDDRGSGMEVRLAEFEMDDRAALLFEFFGAGEDGQRAFAVQL